MEMVDDPLFSPLLIENAPLASRSLLEQARRHFGFVPNFLASLAHSPSALGAYLAADIGFQSGTLTAAEQQIVLLAASKENDCHYCTTAHGALAKFFMNVPSEVVTALENNQSLSDAKLNALVCLTRQLVARRGHAPRQTVDAFLDAGYSKGQLLEVLVGVGLKTISNYFDHISAIEVDLEFQRSV
ncbi:putative peroxidase-related enzyme [Silvibacterium bohemicum]|uniref:Putative peroxidase-related enzyme n=1 Tax=Silvibacterium bohemicum TaxID=1577686 RepID=A0A841JNV0_9BACT|nr:carboxymuconolactone decarboxylase family protein [Silvibacterium bohemicum]MBB6143036.1 putative peroxidase-related enzyme [Silvibacterium bohemicum]